MSLSIRPARHVRQAAKSSRLTLLAANRLVTRRLVASLIVASAFLSLQTVNAAAAQAPSEQELLFQKMLRNPKDIEVTFAYVKVATERGDYEAAIGALERILFYQPGLARVKYELGSLYFRLGSYEMARRYFREALASPGIDPATRDRIEASLPDAEKQLQQSRLSGFVATGLRYQTNASYAPTSGVVRWLPARATPIGSVSPASVTTTI